MKYTLGLGVLLLLTLGAGYAWHIKTSVAPNPVPATASTETTYTAAQIAAHNTAQNCWTSVNGGVYDLTGWIGEHPGGEGPILSICGNDGTSAFMGEHARDPRAASVLKSFRVGALAK